MFEATLAGTLVSSLEILAACRGLVTVVSISRAFVNVCKDITHENLIKIRKEGNKYFCSNIGEVHSKSLTIKKKLILRGALGRVSKVPVTKHMVVSKVFKIL